MKTMKFFAFVVAACMLLAGCSQSTPQQEGFSVGILQYMEHTSLDEIRTAVEEELQQKATELGKPISVEVKNAQGDPTNIGTIANQFVGDNKDLIIAIATPAAAGAAAVTEEIPIVFSAVTNPVEDLQIDSLEQPGGNITGTSDAIPVEKIINVSQEITPQANCYGILYCTSEPSSTGVVQQAKKALEQQGKTFVEAAVTNTSEVQQATEKLVEQCDAIFVPIDNTVATAMSVVADLAKDAKIPVYAAADSMVRDGALASAGVNYTNLGKKTAQMAVEILQGANPASMEVQVMEDVNVVVNEDTAKAIGVDVSQYLQ